MTENRRIPPAWRPKNSSGWKYGGIKGLISTNEWKQGYIYIDSKIRASGRTGTELPYMHHMGKGRESARETSSQKAREF